MPDEYMPLCSIVEPFFLLEGCNLVFPVKNKLSVTREAGLSDPEEGNLRTRPMKQTNTNHSDWF